MTGLWVLIRAPLKAIERGIEALKERTARRHEEASRMDDTEQAKARRVEADQDDACAEALKESLREKHE